MFSPLRMEGNHGIKSLARIARIVEARHESTVSISIAVSMAAGTTSRPFAAAFA
jgi:hypothetical protein